MISQFKFVLYDEWVYHLETSCFIYYIADLKFDYYQTS